MQKTKSSIRRQYRQLQGSLDERGRREWAASEALALGRGGIAIVSSATGLVASTIGKGIRELKSGEQGAVDENGARRVRRPGGGRKRKEEEDPTLLSDLESLVEPETRGDPMSPLRWTCKSLRRLADELVAMGHEIGFRTVARLLKKLGYGLQANKKTTEGKQHPDRDAQFRYINRRTKRQLASGNPAISVDTKKKELVGNYKNGGRELMPQGEPDEVDVHDFRGELGRASPYGVYDIGDDSAWVSVGISSDTAEFAVESIRRWWNEMGYERYSDLDDLFVTADGGGSNGYRTRLWKLELQQLADEIGVPVTVCHFPPGTSKWNKIEHRLFSFITMNWRGKPLRTYQTIVNLIAATTTETGLDVHCELDDAEYEKGRKVTDDEMAVINIRRHRFHPEWNYTISPRS
ncbi:MAG: ISAzo13 family transposase [Nitrosopumilus sp.]|nr:ISAzo13 family transposase [Nitrosopumilus sp.]